VERLCNGTVYRYSGYADILIIKIDSSGAKQWTKQMGTTGFENANGVAKEG